MEKDFEPLDDTLKEHIKRLVNPIFERVLKESKNVPKATTPNRLSVGVGRFGSSKVVFYQPHNLRLYFDFNKTSFDKDARVDTDLLGSVVISTRNYGSECCFKNFLGCEIVVKKKTIEVRDYRSHKRWYSLNLDSASSEIVDVFVDKTRDVINILKEFVRVYGGKTDYNLLNIYSEDKVSGEDAVNLIPLKQHFHSKVVKKVYNDSNVEFSSPAFSSHYLEQRATEDFVSNKLGLIQDDFKVSLELFKTEALSPLTEQIKLHLKVQEATLKALQGINDGIGSLKDSMPKNPLPKASLGVFYDPPLEVSDEEIVRRLAKYG